MNNLKNNVKKEEFISLYNLGDGKSGTVSRINSDPLKARIMEMGIIPGKEIKNYIRAPFGGPLYSHLESFCIAIRKEEADLIIVKIK